jgi:TetR/AcrR family transcriptional regulator
MLVEQMFEQAVTQHGNMRGRQRAYAASFIGLMNTYIGLWLNGHTELNDELVYRVVHQFEHGVYS